MNGGCCISYEIALRWMSLDLTDDKSTLVQVMAWCHQATSHYLNQCWPRSMSPNDVTRPQWVDWLVKGILGILQCQRRRSIVCIGWCRYVHLLNSLAPGKFEWHIRYLIFQIISVIDGWGISCELALRWMSLDLADDKSTLVQVMAWCRQATSHYLSQW